MAGSEGTSSELIARVISLFGAVMKLAGPHDMEEMLKLDLTMPQMKVLMVLWHSGPTSVGGLASALRVALPTMTGILDRLVEHGLVQRYESPGDRRLVINRLTEAGATAVGRWRQAGFERATSVLRHLPSEDLEELARALEKLRLAAEQESLSRNKA